LHLVGILFPHINNDARSKSLQIKAHVLPFYVNSYMGHDFLKSDIRETSMPKAESCQY